MARATKTFNRDDCFCGLDHDTLDHIVRQTLALATAGRIHSEDQFVGIIVKSAEEVGWVKAGDELEDLRAEKLAFGFHPSAEQQAAVLHSERPQGR